MQPKMSAVVMKVMDVLGQQPFEVPLIQHKDMIQQVMAATTNPALGNPVLPGAAKRGSHCS